MRGYNNGYDARSTEKSSISSSSSPSPNASPLNQRAGDVGQTMSNSQVIFGLVVVLIIALSIFAIKRKMEKANAKKDGTFQIQ